MTRLLVRIVDGEDAEAATTGGADTLDLRVADAGRHMVARGDRALLRLTIADDADLSQAPSIAARIGAHQFAVPMPLVAAAADLIRHGAGDKPALVAILQADEDLVAPLAGLAGRAVSVMVETRAGVRLMDVATIARLDAFARACRELGLPFGLAGSLETPDVARLLVLRPDLLGFDLAARHDHKADRKIDRRAVEALRALVPFGSIGSRAVPTHRDETDHIFVHDFVALLSIGAYQAERGQRQRVRFSVDADVRRPTEPPTDMRGVFSYDIIIETIRVLAERPHVTFVETLAEELAESLLAYPQLTLVTIKVEKLDVIEGSVGIVIHRHRHGAR